MFIETSAPHLPGDLARLESTAFMGTKGACVSFWYHMYGEDIGELYVFLRTDVGGEEKELVQWFLAGQQQDDQTTWLEGKFGVVDPKPYQVK